MPRSLAKYEYAVVSPPPLWGPASRLATTESYSIVERVSWLGVKRAGGACAHASTEPSSAARVARLLVRVTSCLPRSRARSRRADRPCRLRGPAREIRSSRRTRRLRRPHRRRRGGSHRPATPRQPRAHRRERVDRGPDLDAERTPTCP